MLAILRLLTTFAANLFKSRRQLEVENLFLSGLHHCYTRIKTILARMA